ncbi:hypothetical protein LJR220_002674 [Bradyrhizobium sp. LjRoot220]|uniref:hypothetical protein n=1 Tax=Bradyrhizobium sp. LjRoot220 TaxID=3342284 RepID=UPI003ECC672C
MYWQYTTALAGSLLATMSPAISSADKEIDSFIFCLLRWLSRMLVSENRSASERRGFPPFRKRLTGGL